MVSVLVRSVALDIWENAIVAGLINASWVSLAFLLGIACTAVSAAAPELALLLIATSIVFLIALLGPIGVYLEILARRETPEMGVLAAALRRSLVASILIALGGMSTLSLLVLAFPLSLRLPDTIAVAATVMFVWAGFVIFQWMILAIGHCGDADASPMQASRDAALNVMARPFQSALILIGSLISIASLVILLPGPSGTALLARRAAGFTGNASALDMTAASMSRRTIASVIFPWKR